MNIDYKIDRYGFYLTFNKINDISGFYWKAINNEQEDIGMIDYSIMDCKKDLFIETQFTPVKVLFFPAFLSGKKSIKHSDLIYPGEWLIKFTNLNSTNNSILFEFNEEETYESCHSIEYNNLKDVKIIQQKFDCSNIIEKICIKKSKSINESIIISDLCLINEKENKIFTTEEELIVPEHEFLIKDHNRMTFLPESNLWSFFSIKFCIN